MSAPTPVLPGCCPPTCESPLVQNIPGTPGADGDTGAAGVNGFDSYSTLTAPFTVPAIGAQVTANMVNSLWGVVGQIIFVQFAGYYKVNSKPSSTALVLENLGYDGNAAPGVIIPTSSQVGPAGIKGLDGSSIDALNDVSPTTGKGQMLVDDGANTPAASLVALAAGANGAFLVYDSTTTEGVDSLLVTGSGGVTYVPTTGVISLTPGAANQLWATNTTGTAVVAKTLTAGTNVTIAHTNTTITINSTASGGDMLAANNLSDVASVATSRTNLGLGTGDSPVFTGATLSGMTLGSVIFAGAAGVLSQDNANLFFDNTNNRLGVTTTAPQATISAGLATGMKILVYDAGAGSVIMGLGVDMSGGSRELSIFQTTSDDANGRISFGRRNEGSGAYTELASIATTAGAIFKGTTIDRLTVVQETLTYGATVDIPFTSKGDQLLALTGDVTFTTSGKAAGRRVKLKILADGTTRNFVFPAWIWVGAVAPASLVANKTAWLDLVCYGAADTDVVARLLAQS